MQLKTFKFKWPIVNATSLDVTESRRSKWVMKSPARIFISVRPSNPRRLSTKRFAINDVVYRSARRAFKDVNEKTNLKLLRNRSTVDGIGYY